MRLMGLFCPTGDCWPTAPIWSGRYEVYVQRFPEGGGKQQVSAPAGRHIHAQMSLLTEPASFFILGLYIFRAAVASLMPYPQNPAGSGNLRCRTKKPEVSITIRSPTHPHFYFPLPVP
jgi:hypothetical protein